MKKEDILIVLLGCAVILASLWGVIDRVHTASVNELPEGTPVILVDAGHGGADGGAVGADGTTEKAINLPIASTLADMLRVMGYSVRETRTEDTMLNTVSGSMRQRKVSDIKERLAMCEQADMTVSIHENHFPQAQYFGTQVFYSDNREESRLLATDIRKSVLSLLQPKNTRALKKGNSDIYLLHKATKPIVLVECGFMSNPTELTKLKDPEYQQAMAFAVAGGVCQYAS